MSTKRKRTKAIGSNGVNYVTSVVENDNSIFQRIELENDIGNDAYIEFVSGEEATSSYIWVQIKAGESYKKKDYYILPTDREHFEYWKDNIAPVVGIVYDPEIDVAFWIDITDHLHMNPSAIENGPYTLHIPRINEFSTKTFSRFKEIFLTRYNKHKRYLLNKSW